MNTLTLPAYAKLNLTLDILRRRADGYHDLRMVMQSVALHDDVRVRVGGEDGIVCRCGDLPGDRSNLAYRAAEAFCGSLAIDPRVEITIEKRIPAAAGMAGGSSDAATVLRALRALLMPELPAERLEALGAEIGSDVPYCIRGGTALAEGRGERLTSLPDVPAMHVVICKPDFPLSTPELFARVDVSSLRDRPDTDGMLDAIRAQDPTGVLSRVGNVFEQVLTPKEREVFAIRDRLRARGVSMASPAALALPGSVRITIRFSA